MIKTTCCYSDQNQNKPGTAKVGAISEAQKIEGPFGDISVAIEGGPKGGSLGFRGSGRRFFLFWTRFRTSVVQVVDPMNKKWIFRV